MDQVLSILLEHMKEQTGILRVMKEEQTGYMKQQTSMNEQKTRLLTSINEHLAKLNACHLQKNKLEDEDDMKKGKGEQRVPKKEEEHDESLNEEEELVESPKKEQSPAPESSSSSAYYRLEIEGVVGVEDQTQGTPDSHTKGKPAGTSHTLTSRSPLNIRVILKKDGEQVQKDDKLAKLRVQLVVLNDDFFIDDKHNSHPSWPLKDFMDSCLHLNENNPTKKIMAVDKGEFRLTKGTGAPHKDATIKVNSNKKLVKLGVMIHPKDYPKLRGTRVLEGVSNSFRVQDLPRANNKGGKTKQGANTVLGKRPMNGVSESSTSPQDPEWNSLASSSVGATLINGCPAMPSQLENTETASRQHSEGLLLQAPSTMGNFSPTPPLNCTAGAHHAPRPHNLTMGMCGAVNASLIPNLEVLQKRLQGFSRMQQEGLSKLANPITIGASSSVPHVPHQENYGAPGGQSNDAQANVVPATDSNMMDVQNSAPSGQSYVPNGINYDSQKVVSAAVAKFHQQGYVPNGINYDTRKIVSAAMAAFQQGNYYVTPGDQSHDAQGNVVAATMNQQNAPGKRKRVNRQENCGQHATGETHQHEPFFQPAMHDKFGDMLQGNNGTGGAQGQPSTPWSNNLHTNSHGHIRTATTTNDFTSAQMDINSTKDDLGVEMGGHEQGDGGCVGNGDYGGGNDGGRVGDEVDGKIWDQCAPIFSPRPCIEDHVWWDFPGTNP